MSEQERIERMSANLGAVIEYRRLVYVLQKDIRLMKAHLERIHSTDSELTIALDCLDAVLPSKAEKSTEYIDSHRTKVEQAVNKLLGEI